MAEYVSLKVKEQTRERIKDFSGDSSVDDSINELLDQRKNNLWRVITRQIRKVLVDAESLEDEFQRSFVKWAFYNIIWAIDQDDKASPSYTIEETLKHFNSMTKRIGLHDKYIDITKKLLAGEGVVLSADFTSSLPSQHYSPGITSLKTDTNLCSISRPSESQATDTKPPIFPTERVKGIFPSTMSVAPAKKEETQPKPKQISLQVKKELMEEIACALSGQQGISEVMFNSFGATATCGVVKFSTSKHDEDYYHSIIDNINEIYEDAVYDRMVIT